MNKKRKPAGYWLVKEHCLEEAKKYDSPIDFHDGCKGAYEQARINGWLKECEFKIGKKVRKLTYELCRDIAITCNSRNDFNKKDCSAYKKSCDEGWIDDWFAPKNSKPSGYWEIYENNHAEAMKYSSRVEYNMANSWASAIALKNGWLDEWFPRINKTNGYWNVKEHCLEEMKKYKTRTEFARENPTAYNYARTNGWLDEGGFVSEFDARSAAMSKPRKWLDRETICAAANECDSISEFEDRFPGACVIARSEGYLYDLFEKKTRERTYERFMEIARKYHTRSEIKAIDNSLYQKAKKEGWIDECDWIPERTNHKPRKWTDEARWEAALQCKTRSEYYERFNGAWNYDNKHGLLDRYTHFVKPVHEGRDPNAEDYVIYLYRDFDNKVVYAGLTYEERKGQRHKEHIYGRKEKDGSITFDVVAKYWQSIGKQLPEPTYVMEGLHINDVGYYEGWYIDKYKEQGWTILNIAKAGSTGGAKVKWNTYEAVATKSKEYKTRSQFCHGCSQAAKKAYDSYTEDGIRWIDTFYWLRDSHEVRSEASRKRQSGKTLSTGHRKNISESLKRFYTANKIIRPSKYTHDVCFELSKKCSNRTQFQKLNKQAYCVSLKNCWLDEFFPKAA